MGNLELPELPDVSYNNVEKNIIKADQFTRKKLRGLLHAITAVLKSRGTKIPHIFLPFRSRIQDERLERLLSFLFPEGMLIRVQDDSEFTDMLKEVEDFTLICCLKYLWSRLPNREIIGYDVYLEFKRKERDSGYPKSAFLTIMPKCLSSPAHASIVYDFLDLLVSIASNSQYNYLSGRKITKMASMWAFNFASGNRSPFYDATSEKEFDFIEGLDSWKRFSNALFHLLLSFLRAMLPETKLETLKLPKTLQSLLVSNSYPPSDDSDSLRSIITIPCIVFESTKTSKDIIELISKVRETISFDNKDAFLSIENYTILKNIFRKPSTEDVLSVLTEESKRITNRLIAKPVKSDYDLYPGWAKTENADDPSEPYLGRVNVVNVSLKDYYIWAWLSSLASDQHRHFKMLFGRSIVLEANLRGFQKWLVITEKKMPLSAFLKHQDDNTWDRDTLLPPAQIPSKEKTDASLAPDPNSNYKKFQDYAYSPSLETILDDLNVKNNYSEEDMVRDFKEKASWGNDEGSFSHRPAPPPPSPPKDEKYLQGFNMREIYSLNRPSSEHFHVPPGNLSFDSFPKSDSSKNREEHEYRVGMNQNYDDMVKHNAKYWDAYSDNSSDPDINSRSFKGGQKPVEHPDFSYNKPLPNIYRPRNFGMVHPYSHDSIEQDKEIQGYSRPEVDEAAMGEPPLNIPRYTPDGSSPNGEQFKYIPKKSFPLKSPLNEPASLPSNPPSNFWQEEAMVTLMTKEYPKPYSDWQSRPPDTHNKSHNGSNLLREFIDPEKPKPPRKNIVLPSREAKEMLSSPKYSKQTTVETSQKDLPPAKAKDITKMNLRNANFSKDLPSVQDKPHKGTYEGPPNSTQPPEMVNTPKREGIDKVENNFKKTALKVPPILRPNFHVFKKSADLSNSQKELARSPRQPEKPGKDQRADHHKEPSFQKTSTNPTMDASSQSNGRGGYYPGMTKNQDANKDQYKTSPTGRKASPISISSRYANNQEEFQEPVILSHPEHRKVDYNVPIQHESFSEERRLPKFTELNDESKRNGRQKYTKIVPPGEHNTQMPNFTPHQSQTTERLQLPKKGTSLSPNPETNVQRMEVNPYAQPLKSAPKLTVNTKNLSPKMPPLGRSNHYPFQQAAAPTHPPYLMNWQPQPSNIPGNPYQGQVMPPYPQLYPPGVNPGYPSPALALPPDGYMYGYPYNNPYLMGGEMDMRVPSHPPGYGYPSANPQTAALPPFNGYNTNMHHPPKHLPRAHKGMQNVPVAVKQSKSKPSKANLRAALNQNDLGV